MLCPTGLAYHSSRSNGDHGRIFVWKWAHTGCKGKYGFWEFRIDHNNRIRKVSYRGCS